MAKRLKDLLGNQRVVASVVPKRYYSAKFGEIFRPEMVMEIWSEKYQEWQKVSVLVDTGADYTILPRYIAVLLGISLQKIKPTTTSGVGGEQRVFFVPDLLIQLGSAQRKIPVGFIDSNQVPPLLGRQAALDSLTWIFDQRNRIYIGE